MSEWRSIETAPKDGTRILGFGMMGLDDKPGIATVAWDNDWKRWFCSPCEASEYIPESCKVSHWMPLPESPE